jgi:hypothetical protein
LYTGAANCEEYSGIGVSWGPRKFGGEAIAPAESDEERKDNAKAEVRKKIVCGKQKCGFV